MSSRPVADRRVTGCRPVVRVRRVGGEGCGALAVATVADGTSGERADGDSARRRCRRRSRRCARYGVEAPRRLPASDAVRPWLFVAARNALANHRRSGRRQQRIRLRLVGEREPALPPADAIDAMQIALQTLDADDFEVVRLRYWDRLPVTEVAAVLGVSPNAVSIRLHRIRAVLREELERPEPERRESRDVG